jgi:hypothetical protein
LFPLLNLHISFLSFCCFDRSTPFVLSAVLAESSHFVSFCALIPLTTFVLSVPVPVPVPLPLPLPIPILESLLLFASSHFIP